MKKLKDTLRESEEKCNKRGYFDSYQDNIYGNLMEERFQRMFDKGSGGELHSKAEAVHSSSMLSYNLFHWIKEETPFEFEGVKYNKVYFEVQMRTLSCKSNPANMDVVLEGNVDGKRHLLFIESKFLEYCKNGKCKLSDSYFNEENWYNPDVRFLIDSVKSLEQKQNGYCEGLKQNITHLFGLYGLANENACNWFNKNYAGEKIDDFQNVKIRFANFIFEPNEEFEEHEAYVNYENLFEAFVRNFLDNKMKPEWYSYSDIWNKMKDQIRDEKLVEFIETRYMQYVKR